MIIKSYPTKWKRKFAIIPVWMDNKIYWLEWFWVREIDGHTRELSIMGKSRITGD